VVVKTLFLDLALLSSPGYLKAHLAGGWIKGSVRGMETRNRPVWVIAEEIDCRILDVSLQLLGRARDLAYETGASVEAILLGEGTGERAAGLISAGADRVYLGDDPAFAHYHPDLFTEIIVSLAQQRAPDILLIGSTCMGRELAPLVAANLRTGLTAHCTDLLIDENGILEQRIPAYGGMISIVCPEKRPQMATVATGVFPRPEPDPSRTGEVVLLDAPKQSMDRTRVLEIVRKKPEGIPLESAEAVVAGGAGARDLEGWNLVAQLADALNAALGATRPAVDEGWIELEKMIGQSGKMVSPRLYIGVGLSGEQQHMCGIVGADLMVAVNNDPNAPVFEQVDYGIVDDCREFIPVFIEAIREYKERLVSC
jgi:electron transfer flavoprotein alpha subunit